MGTTARAVLEQAYLTSSKNDPREIEASSEPLARVNRALAKAFAVAARVNPAYFALRSVVQPTGGSWPRPAEANSVFFLQDAAGAEVAVVPFYDPDAEPSRPAVYELGGRFYGAGRTNDPTGPLTVWASRHAAPAASLDTSLDASFPEAFAPLLAADVAVELALKDGRDEEVPGLVAARDFWLRLFVAHLEHATVGEAARFVRRFRGPALQAGSLFTGGSEVAL